MKPMLAKDADPAKLRFPLVAQPKLDGIRCLIVADDSFSTPMAKPVARSLKTIPNTEILYALSDPRLIGLDGEIIVGDPTAPDAFQRTTSFVRGAGKTGEPWAFYVFDKWDEPGNFLDRYDAAERALQQPGVTPDGRCRMVANHFCQDEATLTAYEQTALAEGYEGVMVRAPAQPYKFGRSYPKDGTLLKVKRFVDFEAEVVGVYEMMHNGNEATTNLLGRTERSSAAAGKTGLGVLGGLVLRAQNGPWAGTEFRCGTGFDAEQRALYWTQATISGTIKGRVAKVKAQNLGAKDKPRFPVFLGWREDFDR
jgi:DNA ligase-1